MESVERFNRALEYIEETLDGKIDNAVFSRIAVCPLAIFRRFFMLVTGITLNEYMRRRKLSRAAEDILNTNERIIDIAVKYGYESQDSFSAAFRQVYNISPFAARKSRAVLPLYDRISFAVTITYTKGEAKMEKLIETVIIEGAEFQIIHKPETYYAGFKAYSDDGDENENENENPADVPVNTHDLFKSGVSNIRSSATPETMICLSINYKEYFHGHKVRTSLMHCQETLTTEQTGDIDVVKSPECYLIKVKASEETWALTKKITGADNPMWHMSPLFTLCEELFCNKERGFALTPDFSDTYEIEYYGYNGVNYAAISVNKI